MIRLLLVVILFIIGGTAYAEDDTIKSESTVISNGTMDTTINSPPPSAISPQISASNSDLCTVGVAGAVQTQILGISAGRTVRDMNCEKLKNAKTMYDMGMKVAAVKEEIQRDQNNPMRKIFNENVETKMGFGVIISTLAFLLLL